MDKRLLHRTNRKCMKCGLLKCAISIDRYGPSRSFQLFLSENKYSLPFRSLAESPGDLMKDDIADDLE